MRRSSFCCGFFCGDRLKPAFLHNRTGAWQCWLCLPGDGVNDAPDNATCLSDMGSSGTAMHRDGPAMLRADNNADFPDWYII